VNKPVVNQKATEAQQERENARWGQPLPPIGGGLPVYQHEDAGGVVELPPAYRESFNTPASAPPPP
jgi:hypothetical protein